MCIESLQFTTFSSGSVEGASKERLLFRKPASLLSAILKFVEFDWHRISLKISGFLLDTRKDAPTNDSSIARCAFCVCCQSQIDMEREKMHVLPVSISELI